MSFNFPVFPAGAARPPEAKGLGKMSTAWSWMKSAGDVYVSILEEWPVATAYAWPASLLAVWWFL